jgi:hypothetical protein
LEAIESYERQLDQEKLIIRKTTEAKALLENKFLDLQSSNIELQKEMDRIYAESDTKADLDDMIFYDEKENKENKSDFVVSQMKQ